MRIDILSLFPDMFDATLGQSIVGRAQDDGFVDIKVTDFRQYTTDKHRHVDDAPFGGGAGMLLQAQPIFDAMDAIEQETKDTYPKGRVILMDPAGRRFDQDFAMELAQEEHLTFICGHYEGYDERIRQLVTDEASLGDYVLTGGELAAMVMVDATVRFVPGVLGNMSSPMGDSFSNGLLEYPQYTRPADFRGMKVPEVLTSGNHEKIREWRMRESLKRTLERRPDLLKTAKLSREQQIILQDLKLDLDLDAPK
ncbi:tRNA (guanosine(37)-N1)-methyltransferase TrmD [Limosilactobacillus fermentum]|uniref:tRNA (guanosine(37)-N1)-methyltransferase TrmD n=1 Tax=Limosilactobacillus fermentum TaxID=1613 RepID=UPI00062D14EE|nr:tRNA (guanosine(37)-N1)-methyltransferase TrmD [Limosilactobacillus fermentum]AZI18690.1 tRNA (guanosine(37)-N1)-methyltransferase TrmD [Limosilactobacillus fermentum]KLD55924.1 tRNA (guanine-N1)-methyltransferase [Limosilactobacillus fermentum]MCT3430585.1 tRNA (guanosine(37)-N1)-methyltransferase TrmD [Limosilactobacillus fermentum]MCT3440364.1 tRNA (guanosine(37)-N1)-methyltransferase TrmD [Limosilactobacillus fermentum]MDC6079856.1 tRNA (guanosine(37)-N1)-methyltransferase TrmD [Limosil